MENFSQAREEVQVGLTDDDYDMYYELWQNYDPDGTEFIPYSELSNFVNTLEEPLGIKKPNRLKLISMNLIICKGDLIHCSDILDALTKNFLGTGEDIEQAVPLEDLKKGKPSNYEPVATTLKRQREDFCARRITRYLRTVIKKKHEKNIKQQLATRATFDSSLTPELETKKATLDASKLKLKL